MAPSKTFAQRLESLIHDVAGGNVSEFVRRCDAIDADNAPSDTMVRKYLASNGSPTLERLRVIAKAGKVSIGWLAGEEAELEQVQTNTTGRPTLTIYGPDGGAWGRFELMLVPTLGRDIGFSSGMTGGKVEGEGKGKAKIKLNLPEPIGEPVSESVE